MGPQFWAFVLVNSLAAFGATAAVVSLSKEPIVIALWVLLIAIQGGAVGILAKDA